MICPRLSREILGAKVELALAAFGVALPRPGGRQSPPSDEGIAKVHRLKRLRGYLYHRPLKDETWESQNAGEDTSPFLKA